MFLWRTGANYPIIFTKYSSLTSPLKIKEFFFRFYDVPLQEDFIMFYTHPKITEMLLVRFTDTKTLFLTKLFSSWSQISPALFETAEESY